MNGWNVSIKFFAIDKLLVLLAHAIQSTIQIHVVTEVSVTLSIGYNGCWPVHTWWWAKRS